MLSSWLQLLRTLGKITYPLFRQRTIDKVRFLGQRHQQLTTHQIRCFCWLSETKSHSVHVDHRLTVYSRLAFNSRIPCLHCRMPGLQSPCPSTNLSLNLYVAIEQILSFLSLGQTLLKLTSQEGSTIVFFKTSRTRQNHLGKIVPFNLIFYCLSLFLICKAIA